MWFSLDSYRSRPDLHFAIYKLKLSFRIHTALNFVVQFPNPMCIEMWILAKTVNINALCVIYKK